MKTQLEQWAVNLKTEASAANKRLTTELSVLKADLQQRAVQLEMSEQECEDWKVLAQQAEERAPILAINTEQWEEQRLSKFRAAATPAPLARKSLTSQTAAQRAVATPAPAAEHAVRGLV